MGLVCGVGFMGAPIILVEKLVGGQETALAFTRLRQAIASGAWEEGGGKVGTEQVRVTEKKCVYGEDAFPTYLADSEDLSKQSLENVPLV